jgi:hypothetical protein
MELLMIRTRCDLDGFGWKTFRRENIRQDSGLFLSGVVKLLAVILRHASGDPDDRLQRMIRYSRAVLIDREAATYWLLRFRGD